MKVNVIARKPVKVIYLRDVGPYGKPLSEFWQNTVYPWLAANHQLGQPRYGISLDDPTITAASKCRYDAGVEARGEITVPGESQATSIAGSATPRRGRTLLSSSRTGQDARMRRVTRSPWR